MSRRDDILLTRHLAGELGPGEAAALEARLVAEPELASRHRRLAELWRGLELPPPAEPPPGFAARIARRATPGGETAAEPPAAGPFGGWARTAGAAALVAGLVLGGGLGVWAEPWLRAALPLGADAPTAVTGVATAEDTGLDDPLVPESAWESAALPSLADTYWSDLEPAEAPELSDVGREELW